MKKNLLILSVFFISLVNNAYSQRLWGMTRSGTTTGINNGGIIFSTDINGENLVVEYDILLGNDGYAPHGSLVQAQNGIFYGMNKQGGNDPAGSGTLFSYDPYNDVYQVEVYFSETNGQQSEGSLVLHQNGKLYGLTQFGGQYDKGVLFEFDPITNAFSIKVQFDGINTGSFPRGSLCLANNLKFYGLSTQGGANGDGVLFEYDPVLDVFSKKIDFETLSSGEYPIGTLLKASNGKLYGNTLSYLGTLFEYDIQSNTLIKLHQFQGSTYDDGTSPNGELVEYSTGIIYGLTQQGGENGDGIIFKYNINTGIYAVLFNFDNINTGSNPFGGLTLSSNGMLYGMTNSGGPGTWQFGVLFEFNPISEEYDIKIDFEGANGRQPERTRLLEITLNEFTWNGSDNSNWNNADNWAGGSVPGASDDVEIPFGLANAPTITGSYSVNNLSLQSNASLKGQENLTINGTLSIERQITGYSSSSDGWHFLSSPVSNQTISGSDFVPSSGDDLYEWGEGSGEWLNYSGGSFGDSEFEAGKGYLVAYDNTATKEFTGNFNTGSVTKNLTYTAGMGDGWNLLGNPYPSAIDWDLITRSGDVDDATYIVNPTDGTYKSWVEGVGDITNGEIPVNQGFFVKANSGGQSVTMELADQVHSSNNFNKSNNDLPENTLKISLNAANSENNTYVRFKYDATEYFDSHSDAYKLFGFAEIPQVYTHLEETDYSINALNFSTEAISIPLGIYLNAEEDLSFNFTGLEGFDGNTRIELEDKTANKIIHLREQSSYHFRGSTSDEAERFVLHFSQVTGLEDIAAQDAQVYAFDGRVYIRLEEGANYSSMRLFDLSGRLLREQALSKQSLQSFDMSDLKGVYLVQLQGEDGSFTEKVTL